MKEIKIIVGYIEDELKDAEKYAKQALHYKDDNKPMAEMYAQLSREEISHMERLHDHAVKIISTYRNEHGAPPAPMLAIWDWEHEKMIEHLARVKHLLSMVR